MLAEIRISVLQLIPQSDYASLRIIASHPAEHCDTIKRAKRYRGHSNISSHTARTVVLGS